MNIPPPLGMQTWSLLSQLSSTPRSAGRELKEIGFNFLEMAGSGNGTLSEFAEELEGRIPIRGAHICSLDQDDNDIAEIISDYVNIFPKLEWLVFFRDFEKESEEKNSAIIERFTAYGEKLKTIKRHLAKEKKENIKLVYHTYTPDYIGVQEDKVKPSSFRVAFELLPQFVMIQLDYYFAATANFMLYKYLADRKDDNRINKRFHSIHLSSRSEETNDRVDLPPSPSPSIHTDSYIAYALRNLKSHYPKIEYILEINDVGSDLNSLGNNFSNFQSYFSTSSEISSKKSLEKPVRSSHLSPITKEKKMPDKDKNLSWPGSGPLINDGFEEDILKIPAVYIPYDDLQTSGKQGSLDPRYVKQRRSTDTLENNFLPHFGNLQRQKKIILEGSAGIGKSTFLAYVIYLFRREKAMANIPVLVLWIDYKLKKLGTNDSYPIEKICEQVANIQDEIEKFTPIPTSITEPVQRTKQILKNFRQKDGYVIFVHDNIDNVGTRDRDTESQVLEEIFSRFHGEGWESCYDTLIIASRPNTLSGLQDRDQLRYDGFEIFNMEPIDIAEGVKARLEYVDKSFEEQGVKMQILGKAIVRRPAKSGERSGMGEKDIPRWWRSVEETKEMVVPIPYYNQTSGSQARKLLWDAGSPVFDPSRIVGVLADRADEVLRYLSGASMRRAVTLTKAMILHPGVRKDLANKRTDSKDPKRTVRSYTIIDSLVDSSLGRKMELNFIANLLDPDVESADSYHAARPHMDFLFKPFFFKYIESTYKSDLEEIYSYGMKKGQGESIQVATEKIIPILEEFGFDETEINRGFVGIELTSLVQRKNGRDARHVGYYINANLLKAHALLMLEPGYIDNCVKYHQNKALRKLAPTVGYDTSDLADRIKNTGIFFKILLEHEAKFCEQIPLEARMKVAGLQIPSIGLSALKEYNERLEILKDLHSEDVKKEIVDFQTQFATEISEIKDEIPFLPDMRYPVIPPGPWVIDNF